MRIFNCVVGLITSIASTFAFLETQFELHVHLPVPVQLALGWALGTACMYGLLLTLGVYDKPKR